MRGGLREKEHKVGKEVGRIWEDLKRRENMIKNILYENKFKKKDKKTIRSSDPKCTPWSSS